MEDDRQAILIAEDEEINRTILREMLKDKYRVLEAENGHQAVFYIKAQESSIALIILDIHMPKLDGFGVMEYLVENGLNEKIPVIITTGDQSTDILLQGKKNKVADIIYKPFRASDIRKRVDNLVEICRFEQKLDEIIEEKNTYLTSEYETIKKAKRFMPTKWEENIKSLMNETMPNNQKHNERIRAYSEIMCENIMERFPQYGLSKSIIKSISEAALLHDIGSLVIPDDVFQQGEASAYRGLMQIKKRPIAASELIDMLFEKSVRKDKHKYAYDIARHMYERYDGKGYPEGLSGNQIPVSAQIVGIVHQYDEMRYPKGGKPEDHRTVMRKMMEADFRAYNPDFLDIFDDISDEIERISLNY